MNVIECDPLRVEFGNKWRDWILFFWSMNAKWKRWSDIGGENKQQHNPQQFSDDRNHKYFYFHKFPFSSLFASPSKAKKTFIGPKNLYLFLLMCTSYWSCMFIEPTSPPPRSWTQKKHFEETIELMCVSFLLPLFVMLHS